jgi:hypothetical protein
MDDQPKADFWTQLSEMTGDFTQTTAVGAFVIQQRVFHPLGWLAFNVTHEKLQQPWRMIVLPEEDGTRPLTGADADAALANVNPPLSVLERVRAAAAIAGSDLPRVVDIEPWHGRMVILVPRSSGVRLSAAWTEGHWSGEQWQAALADFSRRLARLHATGLHLAGCDPLLLSYDATQGAILIDDLVSGPWLEGSLPPAELTADERTLLLRYRRHRADRRSINQNWREHPWSAEADWFEFGAWLTFLAESNTANPDFQPGVHHWREAAESLQETLVAARSVEAWRERWFADPLPQVGSSLSPSDACLSSATGQAIQCPQSERLSTGLGKPSRKGSFANKNLAKREVERRKQLTTAVALALPLPIFLLGFLLFYFLWPAAERLPELANQNTAEELPIVELPNSNLPAMGLTDRLASVPSQPAGENLAETAAIVTGETSINRELATSSQSHQSTDDEMLTDLAVDETDGASVDANEIPPLPTLAKPDPTIEEGLGDRAAAGTAAATLSDWEAAMTSGEIADRTPDLELDGPFVEYIHVLAAVDVIPVWRELSAPAYPNQTLPVGISLGNVNRVTAQSTALRLKSTGPGDPTTYTLRSQVPVRSPVLQGWEVIDLSKPESTPLALIEARSDGRLLLLLWPTTDEDLANFEQIRLELFYQDALSHPIALRGGPKPELVTRHGDSHPLALEESTDNWGEDKSAEEGGDRESLSEAGDVAPDLRFDPRTAVTKTWVKETPNLSAANLEWRFQLAGKPLRALEKDNSIWRTLKTRPKDQPYILEELFDAGSIVFAVATEVGSRTRIQGRLQFLTPSGLRPLTKGAAAEAANEALQFQQGLKAQFEHVDGTRAKDGKSDLKRANLNQLEAMIREMDRYRESLKFAIEHEEELLTNGVAFELVQHEESREIVILRSQGYRDTMVPGSTGN